MKCEWGYKGVCYVLCVMKRKQITIRDDQEIWVQENTLNLSRFVQKKLDELMKNAV